MYAATLDIKKEKQRIQDPSIIVVCYMIQGNSISKGVYLNDLDAYPLS